MSYGFAVKESLFLLALSIVLPNFFIVEPGAGTFLFVSAVFLAMKNYTGWYMVWEFIRELMDMKFAGPIIARMAETSDPDDELGSIHLASFPKDLPPDIRKAAISHLARIFSSEDSPK